MKVKVGVGMCFSLLEGVGGDLRFKGVVERCEWLSCVKSLCGLDHLIACVCGDSEHFLCILFRQNLRVDSQVTLHFGQQMCSLTVRLLPHCEHQTADTDAMRTGASPLSVFL